MISCHNCWACNAGANNGERPGVEDYGPLWTSLTCRDIRKPPKLYHTTPSTFTACTSLGFIGLSGYGGGLSEYVAIDEGYLHKLPDNVSRESHLLLPAVATSEQTS